MNADFSAVLWKEWREILAQRSAAGSGKYAPLISLGILGVGLPLRMGPGFFEPPQILMITFFSLVGVLVVGVDAFAGERERHTLETLLASRLSDRAILFGKIAASITYGWLMSWTAILAGTIAVNLAYGHGRLLIFRDAASWLVIALAPPLVGGIMSTVGVLVSLRAATVRQAMQTLTSVFMLLPIVLLFFGRTFAPLEWKVWLMEAFASWSPSSLVLAAAAALLVMNFSLFLLAMARFQRSKLVSD